MIGIYKIENLITGKVYIGQSTDILNRWKQEISAANNINNRAYNYPLSTDIRTYGLNAFDFQVLEECSAKELSIKEKSWIDHYDSYNNGYNQTSGGSTINKTSEERIEIVKNIKHQLKTTNLFHREIAELNNVSTSYVQMINSGKIYYDKEETYPLQTQQKGHATSLGKKPPLQCIKCGALISKGATLCQKCYDKSRQTVFRPNREEFKKLIRNHSFVAIGKQYGVSDNAIRKWCDAYNLPRTKKEITIYTDKEWEQL